MIKFLIDAFFLPPGIFLVLLAVGLVMLWHKKPQAKWWLLASFVLGWVLSSPITARLVGAGLIAAAPPAELMREHQPDLIVVLTGGIQPAGAYGWLPKQETFKRMAIAFQLQEQYGLRVPIVVSGGFTYGARAPSEAAVALNYFGRQRAQITPVIVEDNSLNTFESALQVASIIKARGADNVLLVTSELHMLRALASYRARGVDAVPVSVPVLSRGGVSLSYFMPSWQGVASNAKVMYELYGLLQYVVSGRVRWQDLS
jgi:uncharacterized SAM-binding protein YcdF (DUF218 family)